MKRLLICALMMCALVSCDSGKKPEASKPAESPVLEANQPTATPDVGKVEHVSVTAKGIGITPGAAVNEALKSAVMQVNGVTVDAGSANNNVFARATATVDVESDQGHDHAKATETLQGQAYAERIIAQSNGVISSFKVVKIAVPAKEGDQYTVDIEAKIAKFAAPADTGKIRIVISPLRTKQQTFDIGGRAVPASEILDGIHRQLVDALTETGRFAVLDRKFSVEIQDELNTIMAGETPKTDLAKLSQALSADLIWVGEINDVDYKRYARQVQVSSTELVSQSGGWSGGWSISQRVINVTTKQIQQSTTLQGAAPTISQTSSARGIDVNQTVSDMQKDLTQKAVESILLRTFPVSVVDREGNEVTLSQGGTVLREKSRYRVYALGKELKDPQTGQSLGRKELPCCDLVIDRVTPTMSYGTLENVQIALDDLQPGMLQLREPLSPTAAAEQTQPAVPAAPDKIRIVISPIRAKQKTFDIGGHAVPARDALDAIQRQLVDALTETGRFTVLDRQYGDEIQGELDVIMATDTPEADLARLGQEVLSADIIWVGEINNLGYARHSRRLQTSSRELVSYSGGWSMSQRIINVMTKQIQQSTTLQGSFPSIAPTTMSSGFDYNQTLAGMQKDLTQKAVESILLRTFPISIIKRMGNQVVLSQGGTAVREKSRYRVYALGEELKDPQTGQLLGRMEVQCCDVVIDRVMPNMSYGTLENVQIPLDDNMLPGTLQLREPLPPVATVAKTQPETPDSAMSDRGKRTASKKAAPKEAKSAVAKPKEKEEDDW
jgi:curli biogenesis system outer membrane secretion channel CsgG